MVLSFKKGVLLAFLFIFVAQASGVHSRSNLSGNNAASYALACAGGGFVAALFYGYYKEVGSFKNMTRADVQEYVKRTVADMYGFNGLAGLKKSYAKKPATTAFGYMIPIAFGCKLLAGFNNCEKSARDNFPSSNPPCNERAQRSEKKPNALLVTPEVASPLPEGMPDSQVTTGDSDESLESVVDGRELLSAFDGAADDTLDVKSAHDALARDAFLICRELMHNHETFERIMRRRLELARSSAVLHSPSKKFISPSKSKTHEQASPIRVFRVGAQLSPKKEAFMVGKIEAVEAFVTAAAVACKGIAIEPRLARDVQAKMAQVLKQLKNKERESIFDGAFTITSETFETVFSAEVKYAIKMFKIALRS